MQKKNQRRCNALRNVRHTIESRSLSFGKSCCCSANCRGKVSPYGTLTIIPPTFSPKVKFPFREISWQNNFEQVSKFGNQVNRRRIYFVSKKSSERNLWHIAKLCAAIRSFHYIYRSTAKHLVHGEAKPARKQHASSRARVKNLRCPVEKLFSGP